MNPQFVNAVKAAVLAVVGALVTTGVIPTGLSQSIEAFIGAVSVVLAALFVQHPADV